MMMNFTNMCNLSVIVIDKPIGLGGTIYIHVIYVYLEQNGQQTSPNGQDWSTTKQSDRHNTTKNGGPLHSTLGKRTEHDDDDDMCTIYH